jgi:hypothetical protein
MARAKIAPKFNYKKYNDEIWFELIKALAYYKCEFSGEDGLQIGGDSVLNSHHINGKPNLRLRYETENGICVTNGIHNFVIHNAGRAEDGRNKIKAIRGVNIFERLNILKQCSGGSQKLYTIKLEQDLAEAINSLPDNIKKARLGYLLADKKRNKPIREFLIKSLTTEK